MSLLETMTEPQPDNLSNELLPESESPRQPRILEPDKGFASSGLPADLWNAVAPVWISVDAGILTTEELLQYALTFDDYYRYQIQKCNEVATKKGEPLYDEIASLDGQKSVIGNPELIARFDKKVMELRGLGGSKTIDLKKVKSVMEEIRHIIYGESN